MNISEVKELMDKFEGSNLREFSWKNAEGELALSKNEGHFAPTTQGMAPVMAATSSAGSAVTLVETAISSAPAESPVVSQAEGEAVKSPLVGVVYLKASPDKAAFVQVGDHVKKGQTLLIIEAMKVMNEISAPTDGVVTEIMVSAEDVVEFGQALVRIK